MCCNSETPSLEQWANKMGLTHGFATWKPQIPESARLRKCLFTVGADFLKPTFNGVRHSQQTFHVILRSKSHRVGVHGATFFFLVFKCHDEGTVRANSSVAILLKSSSQGPNNDQLQKFKGFDRCCHADLFFRYRFVALLRHSELQNGRTCVAKG